MNIALSLDPETRVIQDINDSRVYDGTKSYDICNWDLDFLPGAAGGINPVKRQRMPSIFLPFSNLIE